MHRYELIPGMQDSKDETISDASVSGAWPQELINDLIDCDSFQRDKTSSPESFCNAMRSNSNRWGVDRSFTALSFNDDYRATKLSTFFYCDQRDPHDKTRKYLFQKIFLRRDRQLELCSNFDFSNSIYLVTQHSWTIRDIRLHPSTFLFPFSCSSFEPKKSLKFLCFPFQ